MAAFTAGLDLGTDEVFIFIPPPILGGGIAVENIEKMDFVVALNLAGQLHSQLKDLPAEATISGFEFRDEDNSK